MTTATVRTLDDAVVTDLEAIMNEPGSVLTNISSRTNRARVPAPFPVHRWGEYVPAAVVLPRTAQQVSEIVKLANRAGIPVVPRAGAPASTTARFRCGVGSSSTSRGWTRS
jgi:glycolate oxidase